LLCLNVTAAVALAQGGVLQVSQQEARKVIQDGNTEWGKARVAHDKATFERMLAPDFYVFAGGQRHTREEFITNISTVRPNVKMTRFDATVLTVVPKGDAWEAIIQEKLEFEKSNPVGKLEHGYSLWVTRDGWRKTGENWIITYSEEVAHELWRNEKPPIQGW
jgi:hypothetical protein